MALDRTWYNALVDDNGTNTTGTLVNKAFIDAIYDDVDAALANLVVSGTLSVGGSTATFGSGTAQWVMSGLGGGSDTYLTGRSGTQKFLRHSTNINVLFTGTSGLQVVNAAETVALATLSNVGLLTLNAYTATTWVSGDKYLVVDASGNVHRSAIGPAS